MLNLNFKSQISFFVILSLIAIVSIVYVINLESSEISENLENYDLYENHVSGDVKLFLDTCYKNSYFNSLQNIGFHGGNFISKDLIATNYINLTNLSKYSYTTYIVNNISIIPVISEIENQFDLGIKYNFNNCLKNKNNFNLSYNISEISTNTQVLDNNKIIINSQLSISNGNGIYKKVYSSFSYTDDYSYLINYLNISKKIVSDIKNYPNQICITCNNRYEKKYNLSIFVNENVGNNLNGVIYYIIKNDLEYNDVKYFSFLYLTKGVKNE